MSEATDLKHVVSRFEDVPVVRIKLDESPSCDP